MPDRVRLTYANVVATLALAGVVVLLVAGVTGSDAPEVVVRTVDAEPVEPGGYGEAVVRCEDGETVVSGGWRMDAVNDVSSTGNGPWPTRSSQSDMYEPEGWRAAIHNPGTGTLLRYRAYVLCAKP